ncbi:MAG: T9SS type A sorting domain-containing protein, partial [Cyclobacteriaceae bacterium]
YYRHRLRTEFMVMGLSQTEHPTERAADFGGNYGHSLPAHNTYLVHEDNYKIWWSDGTIDLGFYISVLATEYKILNDGGFDTSETLEELFYALKAYERLDSYSNNVWDDDTQSRKNGFFIRDDVTSDIFDQNPIFEKYKDASGNYVTTSDYMGSDDKEPSGFKTITPEQYHSLLMGFALVKVCVGDATYNGFEFKNSVMTYAETTAKYLEDRKWKVKDENGDLNRYGKVFRMEGHAWIAAKAVGFISDRYKSKEFLDELTPAARMDFRIRLRVASGSLARLPTYTVAHMAMGVAVGEGLDPESFLKKVQASYILKLTPYPTYVEFIDNDLYYLLWNFLRNRNGSVGDPQNIDEKLIAAPCYGPLWRPSNLDRNHPYYEGEQGWRSDNRWVKASKRNEGDRRSKMNGLDYMLMYNLYVLYYGQHNPELVGDIPSLAPGAFPLTYNQPTNLNNNIYAYNTVNMSSNLNLGQNVEILGKIRLTDGFHYTATNRNLRLLGGARNACGDILDEYGDIEALDNTALFGTAARRASSQQQIAESIPELPETPLSDKQKYKPLDNYLEERAVSSEKVLAYLNPNKFDGSKVFVYPNPAVNEVNISFPKLSEKTTLEILDLNGRVITSQTVEEGYTRALIEFPDSKFHGVCFVKLSNTSNTVVKKLIIK